MSSYLCLVFLSRSCSYFSFTFASLSHTSFLCSFVFSIYLFFTFYCRLIFVVAFLSGFSFSLLFMSVFFLLGLLRFPRRLLFAPSCISISLLFLSPFIVSSFLSPSRFCLFSFLIALVYVFSFGFGSLSQTSSLHLRIFSVNLLFSLSFYRLVFCRSVSICFPSYSLLFMLFYLLGLMRFPGQAALLS